MTTYALNGLGRMGKLALRPLLERGAEIVFVNDAVGDPAMHAHLLEFDTVHGRWPASFAADDQSITIDGTRIPCRQSREIADLPLEGVDVVIDCTGVFKSAATLQPYFDAGVKKVVVSAPVKDGNAANIVMGVNHDRYDPAGHRIVTAASCTTDCLAPVVKVIHENLGIKHGSITTIHDVTNTQVVVDHDSRLVVGNWLCNHTNDKQAALPTMDTMAPQLGKPKAANLDTGYFSQDNIKGLQARGIDPYIATGRSPHHRGWRAYFLDNPDPPEDDASVKEQMAYKLRTAIGKALYRLRKSTVEPVIGIIKEVLGFRQFSLRGLFAAGGEWTLVCLAYNLKRLHTLQVG